MNKINSQSLTPEECVALLSNTNVQKFESLTSVRNIRKSTFPSEKAALTISQGRQDFANALTGKDDRFIIVTGPCSIHDTKAAIEYGKRLSELNKKVSDHVLLYMRTYFEKPRTALGWKGLINDPMINGSFHVELGLKTARNLLINLAEMGIYTATELLDPITAAYLAELVTWVAIGARTTESQIHREMVSGISSPAGFKNSTGGNLAVALNAMKSSSSPHRFLGTDENGNVSIVHTKGNPNTHLVLRGGENKPNYSKEEIIKAEQIIDKFGFPKRIMVDCSHDNSGKNHEKQSNVVREILKQRSEGNNSVFSVMIESHLYPGSQPLQEDPSNLKYGVSITDKCIGWQETEELILEAYEISKQTKNSKKTASSVPS